MKDREDMTPAASGEIAGQVSPEERERSHFERESSFSLSGTVTAVSAAQQPCEESKGHSFFPYSQPTLSVAGFFPEGVGDCSRERVGATGDRALSNQPGRLSPVGCNDSQRPVLCGPDKKSVLQLEGMSFHGLGPKVAQWVLEVIPLRSQPKGEGKNLRLFPLPTSRATLSAAYPTLQEEDFSWLVAICVSLNSMWGGDLFFDGEMSHQVKGCVDGLIEDVVRLRDLKGSLELFDWSEFFATRSIDYKGDEVKTAKTFRWENVAPALPAEIGRVPLEEVCTLGAQYYVTHIDQFIGHHFSGELPKPPRVMVADEHWAGVCKGLVEAGVCVLLPRDEIYQWRGRPLLNGLFGVSKDEWAGGFETFRLIMNLVPLNTISKPLQGDIETLPSWSTMSPFFLQPNETLLVSSEDVRCFFYTMSVPQAWWKFLGFNKPVPSECLPQHLKGQEVYLAARVLPMGFMNSVSLAQHVHRNLALWSGCHVAPGFAEENRPEQELRKDLPMSISSQNWRIYLDNYDLLEKVRSTGVVDLEGTMAPAVLCLRQEYERWEVPINKKKTVARSRVAEVQGALVDGEKGLAFPRESKLLKYVGATLALLGSNAASQKEMQVVCGGLVYFSMFRRQLLGGLNAVWRFITSFDQGGPQRRPLPLDCKVELIRFVALVPLARMNFRLEVDAEVTCSDASTQGGGLCASRRLSRVGELVSEGKLRGEIGEPRNDHKVLSIGLFDGIAALRVALDLLGQEMVGHISVEPNPAAQRVVESHFPETVHVTQVQDITEEMVESWSLRYSQAALVVIGAGPPCQGVSGLNADRRGALRDERSSLFTRVKRIEGMVQRFFCWAQVHTLMESVASMDQDDRDHMSSSFGDEPWACDAGQISWCSRPRLYWLTWELLATEGVTFVPGDAVSPRSVRLCACQDLDEVCKEGWTKVDPSRPFPTFTTARPRDAPGRKPAGVAQCTAEDIDRWVADQFRFPPYQYCSRNGLINSRNEIRVPDIEEREIMMGFPVGYTAGCSKKSDRKKQETQDMRLTLIGNSWSIPVVAWFLSTLLWPLGLCKQCTPQDIVDLLNPFHQSLLQARLWRLPLRPLRYPGSGSGGQLVSKLCNLISIKGEDVMVNAASSQMTKYHRLRASVPARLWHWKIVTGWAWTGGKEHINCLELRAILTALKWKIAHRGVRSKKFLHLTDSLVALHALSRGRSSSRKLRSTLSRINALLLASSCQGLWGYVHTDLNPADKPSRWGRKVRTKFRNA